MIKIKKALETMLFLFRTQGRGARFIVLHTQCHTLITRPQKFRVILRE